MKHYNYIIAGGGASGLLLAYRMATDAFFDDTSILIIDKEQKTANDRTWCFWEAPGGEFDRILFKTWDKAVFKSDAVSRSFSLHPFRYKMIRSADFYDFIHREIAARANITLLIDTVISIDDMQDKVQVKTATQTYSCEKAFTSIFDLELLYRQRKYPVLQQHFLGWFITSGTAVFDAQTVTFMDFTVRQRGNTRFMYVLPFSETEALVEYTLFSEETLAPAAYEDAIREYLAAMGIPDYTVTEVEKGSIPMTCYDFAVHNSGNVLHIGTAGGWTKPSTGYTFLNAVRRSGALASFLKKGLPLTAFGKKTRFWYYDLLFLDVLHRDNASGRELFSAMFKRNAPGRIFRFLDERTTAAEDVKVLFSLPPRPFVKSLLKRIF